MEYKNAENCNSRKILRNEKPETTHLEIDLKNNTKIYSHKTIRLQRSFLVSQKKDHLLKGKEVRLLLDVS